LKIKLKDEREDRIMTEEQLVTDADHVQLSRLVTEISWLIDHGEAHRVCDLFIQDGSMNLGDITLSGREAIQAWGRELISGNAYPGIRHVSTNMRFLSSDVNKASGVSLVTAYINVDDGHGSTLPLVIGEDNDEFVRLEGRWQIVSRSWVPLFVRATEARKAPDVR
jgi:hypothetical protein